MSESVRARTRRALAVLAAAAGATVAATVLVPVQAAAAPPYANCTAVWQQLGRPIFPQDAGYNYRLDADKDGVGCEVRPSGVVAKAPPAGRVHALQKKAYNHLGSSVYGQVRSDSWVLESFSAWPNPVAVQGVSRVVKVARATRVQVSVTELRSENGILWVRNATAKNSGTASSATQVTPRVAVTAASSCAAPARVRVRSSLSVRWTDGTLSTISVTGPLTTARWCRS